MDIKSITMLHMRTMIILTLIAGLGLRTLQAQEVFHYKKIEGEAKEETEVINAAEDAPTSVEPNYEAARYYYNNGVDHIESVPDGQEFVEIDSIQKVVMDCFKKALPYAERAHLMDPSNEKILQLLAGVHYGLNDLERSEFYQKQIELLREE